MNKQDRLHELNKIIRDPATPQGVVANAKDERWQLERKIKEEKEAAMRKKNNVDYYYSDDYCGLSAGKFDFYYGYEVTRCPVKSHRTDDDCYEKNCDKREWVFQASIDGKVVFEKTASELGDVGCMDGGALLTGIGIFLQTLPPPNTPPNSYDKSMNK